MGTTNGEYYFDDKLLEPLHYITRMPGKKIRTKLIQSFNYWLKIEEDVLKKICDIIELLHNSSLLIDDIEDHSVLRRGMPVAHDVYGVPLTINAANYAYFLALRQCLELNSPKCVQIFTDQLIELHRGQGMEIWFRDTYTCPTQDQYVELVNKKTGGLFKLAIDLMQVHSKVELDAETLINSIGLFFQVRDDLANLCSTEYADAKSFCEDLTEGKFSFPVIHFMRTSEDSSQMLDILKKRTHDVDTKRKALSMLESAGSFKFTVDYLRELRTLIFAELAKLNGNAALEQMLRDLCKLIE